MAYITATPATGSTFGARTAALFQGVVTKIKRRKLYRETFEGLSALTTRELTDLGLDRSDLRRVSWESANNAVL